MKRQYVAIALVGWVISMTAAAAQDKSPAPSTSIRLAQGASSCSGWQSICESRGPGCAAKFKQCLKSGCWTEGANYGGATHCGLAKR